MILLFFLPEGLAVSVQVNYKFAREPAQLICSTNALFSQMVNLIVHLFAKYYLL